MLSRIDLYMTFLSNT